MELDRYLDALHDDLHAAAALGDEEARRAATLLATALRPSARLMLMSAISDFASEVSALLGDTVIDVTLRGRDVQVGVRDADETPDADPWPSMLSGAESDGEDDDLGIGRAVREAGDELSRTTLRLVNRLKAQAEHAATVQGVSLNTYIQRAVADAVRSAGRRARRGPNTGPAASNRPPHDGAAANGGSPSDGEHREADD